MLLYASEVDVILGFGDALHNPTLRAVLRAFPNGSISVFDRALRYVYAAGRGLSEVGLTPESLIGRPIADLFDPSSVALAESHYRRAFEGEDVQFELPVFGRTYHMSAAPLAQDDRIDHIVVVAQDITDRKNDETRDINARRAQTDSLRELDRRKTAFITTLAHELRQPLAAMTAAIEVLKTRYPQIASTSPVSVLDRQIGHVRRLLDDVVDASRLVMGRVTLARERIDLKAVVSAALETVAPAIEARAQRCELNVPDEPVEIEGDLTRLQQVFSNLLNNASKYGRRGGYIRVWIAYESDAAVVRVRDDGVGIPPELLPHIFELFTQASAQDRGGIGVGLAVVRGLVVAHGGTVTAQSEGAERGSEFVVRLPIHVTRR